jgi:chemotaxis protein methyltransferase CheR
MNPAFTFFRELAQERSGLVLGEDKYYLVETRLRQVAERLGFRDVEALLTKLQFGPTEALISECVEALATHESSFFRDAVVFEEFTSIVLPQLLAEKHEAEPLRIWSAACSSGQEPYSIAITLLEIPDALSGHPFDILATDFVPNVLALARTGKFSEFEIQRGLSEKMLKRWFHKTGESYQVAPEARRHVTFLPQNLLEPFHGHKGFDIIFCRNVLIYFSREARLDVLERLARALRPGGVLVLGSAESIYGASACFEAIPRTHSYFIRKSS